MEDIYEGSKANFCMVVLAHANVGHHVPLAIGMKLWRGNFQLV